MPLQFTWMNSGDIISCRYFFSTQDFCHVRLLPTVLDCGSCSAGHSHFSVGLVTKEDLVELKGLEIGGRHGTKPPAIHSSNCLIRSGASPCLAFPELQVGMFATGMSNCPQKQMPGFQISGPYHLFLILNVTQCNVLSIKLNCMGEGDRISIEFLDEKWAARRRVFLAVGDHPDGYWLAPLKQLEPCSHPAGSVQRVPLHRRKKSWAFKEREHFLASWSFNDFSMWLTSWGFCVLLWEVIRMRCTAMSYV